MINLTTFFTSFGIVNGNTEASNFYEFWKGIEMSGGTIINNITEFMTYLGTTRYEFFKSLQSTYPEVYDEYTFYQNIDDIRIYDYYTFYTYAGLYFPTTQGNRYYGVIGINETDVCTATTYGALYQAVSFPTLYELVYSDSDLTQLADYSLSVIIDGDKYFVSLVNTLFPSLTPCP
jgi:hypothetical protein